MNSSWKTPYTDDAAEATEQVRPHPLTSRKSPESVVPALGTVTESLKQRENHLRFHPVLIFLACLANVGEGRVLYGVVFIPVSFGFWIPDRVTTENTE